jgi:hypothetical protein
MEFKKQLYLEAQADNQQSELKKSLLVPGFPTQIKR